MKKFISLIITLSFLLSYVPGETKAASPFSDVSQTYRFSDEIVFLTDKGIITGFPDDSFRPNNTVTRAQAAIMIGRALGLNGTKRDTSFKDVDASVIASGYIASAVDKGIITGYHDNTYRPNEPVTRGQMAIFLSRAYKLSEEAVISFSDVSASMSAYVHIKRILAEGITFGYPNGTFKPNNHLSRGDFSAFMARAINDKFKTASSKTLTAHFIDVGQGDSSLVVTPNGKTILIDGGKDASGEKVVAYLREAGVRTIDLLVATHPDADHIGGLKDVINAYTIMKVLDSGKNHTSQTYLDYLALIDQKNIPFEVAVEGSIIPLDEEIQIQVLNSSTGTEDTNESSIVLKMKYGQIDFLFTGDAGVEQEAELVTAYNVEAEILKVGHHGSNTSSSELFLREVRPKESILSYAEGNYYGHPFPEIVDRLTSIGSNLYSTAKSGDIKVTTNGTTYQVSSEPWQTGVEGNPVPEQPTPAPTPIPTPTPTSNSVDLAFVNRETEIVGLKNTGKTNIIMTGWRLVSVEGNQTFEFPIGYELIAGATVYIKSGRNAVHNPPSSLLWTNAYMWNNEYDPAKLFNPSGVLIDSIQ